MLMDMDHNPEEENEYYIDMKNDTYKVRISEGRCPFCSGEKEQDYIYKDVLQHATESANSGELEEKVNHLALVKYLKKYLAPVTNQSLPKAKCSTPSECDRDELFVWPWVGVIANIPIEKKNGRFVGESGTKLREYLTKKGFNPTQVHPLWSRGGHSGYAIVSFEKDWPGFKNAMAMEQFFETDHHGRRDWLSLRYCHHGSSLYGWVARKDDYICRDIIGNYLTKVGDLKTCADIVEEEKRKTSQLVTKLTNVIGEKDKNLNEIRSKYDETNNSLKSFMEQKDRLHQLYNEEKKKMHQNAQDNFRRMIQGHEKLRSVVELERKELEARGKELEKREAQNENDRRKLVDEKK
ncbi:hypothetical protein GIB67_002322 [Kingdonia uniflora]|uniref:XS domain-containing protein n=1 Tax=Kingdonia uniflora TaxID=39325 RepID=A0A7J7KX33_9MAGN|nr:hypothetical protein GIB67_002322 [Kingdonia uniflora]